MEATREKLQSDIDRAIANQYAAKVGPVFVTKMGDKAKTLSPAALTQVDSMFRPRTTGSSEVAPHDLGSIAVRTAAQNVIRAGNDRPIKPSREAVAEQFRGCGDWALAFIRAQRVANSGETS